MRQSHSNSHYSAPCVARSRGDRLHSRSNSNFFETALLSSRNAFSRPRGQHHFERTATTTGSGSRQLRSVPSSSRRPPVNLLSQLGQADSQPVDSISHPARLLHQVHASPAEDASRQRFSADHRPLNSHPEVEGQTRHRVVRDCSPDFYSPLFVIPKRDGGSRPVFNLRKLNEFVHAPHFKMETMSQVLNLVRPGDYMTSLDLSYAFLHVKIHPRSRKYLRFRWTTRRTNLQQRRSAWNGQSWISPRPQYTLFVDASDRGWGAVLDDTTVQQQWTAQEKTRSINWRELQAIYQAVRAFPQLHDTTVLIRTDNISAMTYINKQGGTRSLPLSDLAGSLWRHCLRKRLRLTALHIPGIENSAADRASRFFQKLPSWQLAPATFQTIQTQSVRRWTLAMV